MTEPVTFVKGDQTRVADSVKEAVQLKFDGWRRRKPGQDAPVHDNSAGLPSGQSVAVNDAEHPEPVLTENQTPETPDH